MSASKFCVTCGTAGAPVQHGVRWGTVFFDLAAGGAASWLLSRAQPALWWLPLAGAVPTALAHARPSPPICGKCGSTQLIPVDSPVAVARMRAMERAADRVIAGEDSAPGEVNASSSPPSATD